MSAEVSAPEESIAQAQTQEPVSVVVTVLNEVATIGRLLDELLGQDKPADEIIVVDGGSSDGTPDVVASHTGPVRLIELENANISQGRNRGIAQARNDIVAVTDAGVRLPPDWLGNITTALQSGHAQVVGGFFQPDPRDPFEIAMGATVLPALEDIDPQTFLPSSRSIAFRKDVWRRVGGYPEWLDYCEDLIFDINIRRLPGVRQAFEPAATVAFRPRSTLAAFFLQYYRYARGDGKADLWRTRHAARYLAYGQLLAVLGCLLSPWARAHRLTWTALLTSLAVGGALYLRKPLRRLLTLGAGASLGEWLRMLALLPVVRVTGDVAKMLGYPAGWLWRIRYRPPDWRL